LSNFSKPKTKNKNKKQKQSPPPSTPPHLHTSTPWRKEEVIPDLDIVKKGDFGGLSFSKLLFLWD